MPDNAIYYHAAYIAAAVIYGGYVVSLFVRTVRARARQDREDARRPPARG
jgi:hypothetical protein